MDIRQPSVRATRAFVLLLIALIFGAGSRAATAATWYVDINVTTPGSGSSWSTAYRHLQDLLTTASVVSGDTVKIADGTYRPDTTTAGGSTYSTSSTFLIPAGVTVIGGFIGDDDDEGGDASGFDTILTGDVSAPLTQHYAETVVTLQNGSSSTQTTKLSTLTVTLGRGGEAAGIYGDCPSIKLALERVFVTECWSHVRAGGAYLNGYQVSVKTSRFLANLLDGGNAHLSNSKFTAGLEVATTNTAVPIRVDDTYFFQNSGEYNSTQRSAAGALRVSEGSAANLRRCLFESNVGGYKAGAIWTEGGDVRLSHCSLWDNSAAENGGAIYSLEGSLRLINCALYGNSVNAEDVVPQGGAIYAAEADVTVENSTLVGNFAPFGGSVIYFLPDVSSSLVFYNTILWDNWIDPNYPIFTPSLDPIDSNIFVASPSFSARLDHCDWDHYPSSADPRVSTVYGGNISADPLFVNFPFDSCIQTIHPVGIPRFQLSDTSPCRNTGLNALTPNDVLDVDGDLLTSEVLPNDLNIICDPRMNGASFLFFAAKRIIDGTVDIGAFEVGCGAADFDGDTNVTIDDIFIFINAWFAGCTGQPGAPCFGRSTDADSNGVLNIDDIFIFLNLWFGDEVCP
jgi:hypothetical protein